MAVRAVYKEWPTAFYGLGPGTVSGDRESYTERFFNIQLEAQRRVLPGIYAGVRYNWRRTSILNEEEGGHLDAGAVSGSEKGVVSGLALLLTWDTRDNIYYPMSGRYHQFEVQNFGGVLGSQYRFDLLKVDMRRYVALSKTQVLAFQGVAQHTTGTPPFWMLSGVGTVIRGYPIPRYVDKSMVAVQVEYRVVPVWWRLGVAVFAGVGQVADSLPAIKFDNLKYAVGLGLRLQLFKQEKMNVRLDYGFGRDSSGDYIDLPEAF